MPLCLAVLHLVVVPLLERLSVRVPGEAFSFRMHAVAARDRAASPARRDLHWSAAAVLLSILIVMCLAGLADLLGIVALRD